jgi:CDP-paratose 2-epimerase
MRKTMLITGGAGFIGVNAALYFASRGWQITVLDNLSRRGSEANAAWLDTQVDVAFEKMDICNEIAVNALFRRSRFDVVVHLAAQVAVTTSVRDPRTDFEINALGTVNILEAIRRFCPDTQLLYASTNKVYGKMEDVGIVERGGRYTYASLPSGVNEEQPLSFHSPYGCSKGAADQYVLDYGRIYGLRTTSFRQSCIYGPRQFGVEDQGWVAWFSIAAALGKPVTVYGDGKQTRDVLHVDDLVRAYDAAIAAPEWAQGEAFNVGGGARNTLSLLELIAMLEEEFGRKMAVSFDDWRPGDQPVFVCDINKMNAVLAWEPAIPVSEGVRRLIHWVRANSELFEEQTVLNRTLEEALQRSPHATASNCVR